MIKYKTKKNYKTRSILFKTEYKPFEFTVFLLLDMLPN